MSLEQVDVHTEKTNKQKNTFDPYFIQYAKINLRWIRDLNIKPRTIKASRRKQDVYNVEVDTDFLDGM